MKTFKKALKKLSELLFPPDFKCVFCSKELPVKTPVKTCEECYKTLPFIKDSICLKCGNPLKSLAKYCLTCKNYHREFVMARATFVYDKPISDMIIRAKYENAKYLLEAFAAYMAATYYEYDFNADFMVSVPKYNPNPKIKKYNQADALAFEFSNIINMPLKDNVLIKHKQTKKQVQLHFKDRIDNIKGSIIVSDEKVVKDKTILLIDDVLTSGATANECALRLKKAGAKKVLVLTLARTNYQN